MRYGAKVLIKILLTLLWYFCYIKWIKTNFIFLLILWLLKFNVRYAACILFLLEHAVWWFYSLFCSLDNGFSYTLSFSHLSYRTVVSGPGSFCTRIHASLGLIVLSHPPTYNSVLWKYGYTKRYYRSKMATLMYARLKPLCFKNYS